MDYAFWNPDLTMDERLDDLLGRLTLEEKVRQMINGAPAIPRLGIPAYDWWNECLHGVARTPYNTTSYPQAIGMASTWDVDAMFKMAQYTSDEGRAIFHDAQRNGNPGIFKGLTYWTPNINIFRDPRWGRGMETYGEDPFLTGEIGASFVRGLQGDDPKYLKASACAKHYAVHSGPEWNRHTFDAYVSDHDLWDTYLPAFEKLVTKAGVSGVMTAYNRFLGQACSTSDVLMTDILFRKWNYQGYVTSDCGAIDDIFRNHKVYDDAASGSAAAVKHGNHCECGGGAYLGLLTAVEKGLISEEEIDSAVRKLFEIRMRLGMFDPDSMVPYADIPLSVLECDKHLDHALHMARESIVLLKNEGGVLPLDRKKIRKIAVIGPNADNEKAMLANYYGFPSEISTILDGIRQKAGEDIEVVYHKGVNLVDNWLFNSAYDPDCFSVDGRKGFKVEYFQNTRWQGVSPYSCYDDKIDHRWGNGTEVGNGVKTNNMSAVWRTTFKAPKSGEICFEVSADDYATLFIDGKIPEKRGLINNYYVFKAKKGRTYEIELRYVQHGDNADVKLDMGYLEQADPQKLASSVADADVILYAGGLSPMLEGEEMQVQIEGFHRGDRESIDIPEVQRQTLKALHATGKPVVLVLMTGSAVGLGWESENLPAIVNAWYGGQRGGEAVADVLFGDYNPAGRLPVTFYRSADDLPDFENYSMQNRTYRYFQGEPVYSFGYGLSYTSFEYSDMVLEALEDGSLKVGVNVRNAGKVDGDEVVQVYLSNKRDFTAPIRSLKAFDRITLKAGEARNVEFVIPADEVVLVDMYGNKVPMAGDVTVSAGGGQPGYGLPCVTDVIKL
ncbi:MAG: glycosyl hydrolase [Bacteroidales bacterium]|nr:glycosyl hydrolase [Bacteroidales bacterium]